MRPDGYADHDPANTRRFAGLVWTLLGVIALAMVPVSIEGTIRVLVAVAICASWLSIGILLLRGLVVGFGTLLAFSYGGMIGVASLQVLAGSDARILHELYLAVALHTATVHPPRRLVPFFTAFGAATFVGVTQTATSAAVIANGLVHLVIWGVVCVVSYHMVGSLRRQRRAAQADEEVAQQLAATDVLTGLGNRRRLFCDLERVAGEATPETPALLVVLDLDGFKTYNDTFGHPAGDELLRRLGDSLASSLDGRAVAYRMGGDEFCILAGGVGALAMHDIVDDAVAALSDSGEGFSVKPSHGAVLIPYEATNAAAALGQADRRMYARKASSRVSADQQTANALLCLLAERDQSLCDHVQDVANLCEIVGTHLGVGEDLVSPLRQAGSLHDVGKAAIPDAILDKPGPLDDAEWSFIRRHTLIGERIMLAAPSLKTAATFVRSSHERWDGGGYPDGLAGETIPLGARVIAACDAFEAMTADRSYRRSIGVEAALAELRRCSGTQFDPAVVDALCAVVEARALRR